MYKTCLVVLVLLIFVMVFSGYPNGPASTVQSGYTGAPCELDGLVCQNCHLGGFEYGIPNSTISLRDTITGFVTQSYQPGRTYEVTVTISAFGFPSYGMQATALDGNHEDVGMWSGPLTSNTQIADAIVTCGDGVRTYIEHRFASRSPFQAHWTAPLCSTDPVTFYHIGNAVNGDGQQSGDSGGQKDSTIIYPELQDTISLIAGTDLSGLYRANDIIQLNGITGSGKSVFASANLAISVTKSLQVDQAGILIVDVDTCQ